MFLHKVRISTKTTLQLVKQRIFSLELVRHRRFAASTMMPCTIVKRVHLAQNIHLTIHELIKINVKQASGTRVKVRKREVGYYLAKRKGLSHQIFTSQPKHSTLLSQNPEIHFLQLIN